MKTRNKTFAAACEQVGSQAEMARLIDMPASMVNQIINGVRPLPAAYCLAIEAATKGQTTRQQLLPNDWPRYWPELAKSAKKRTPTTQAA